VIEADVAAAPTVARFPAMSVTVTILGSGVPAGEVERAATAGAALAEAWENAFSRFRPESALSRLNAGGGAPLAVGTEFLDVLELARAGVLATGGRFDPSVLPALEAAGYDRHIDRLRAGEVPAGTAGGGRAGGVDGWRHVRIDRARGVAQLPPDLRIDLGGIAKGAFVDRLAQTLSRWPGGMVDAGGDLRVWGVAPDGGPWRVAIEDPLAPDRDLAVADVLDSRRAGGVATSGIRRRSWTVDGRAAHHLIDPATGLPLAGGGVAATAFAPTCAAAEIATKALLVGAASGRAPDAPNLARGLVIGPDGATLYDDGGDRDAVEIEMVPVTDGDGRA